MFKRKILFAALFAPLAILFLSAQISAPPVYSPRLGIGGAPPTSNGDLRVYGNFQLDGTCTGCPVTSPAGSNTQVQFNNAGAFGGDAGFTYNSATDTATIGTIAATSGTIGGSNICRADGTNCVTTGAANPSATVGLTATNGAATTYARSDSAPALSQAITPTWTGLHQFNAGVSVNAGATAATSFMRPLTDATLYSLLGRSQAGPGIQARWDSGTTNRYVALGKYDNAGVWTAQLTLNDGGEIGVGASNSQGTSGQVLTSAGAGSAPTWSNPSIAKTCTAACDLTGLLVGQSAMIRKPNTQSVTSSTTLTADNELQFSNAPTGGYIMEGLYQVTDGGGGVRVGFSASGVSATGNASCGGTLQVLSVTTTNPGAMQCATAATSVFTYQGIITRGTAGFITVMFAQQTSNVAATTMGTDSFVMLTRYY